MARRIVGLAILIVLLLSLGISVYAQKEEKPKEKLTSKPEEVPIAFGKEPVIDGKIEEEEWKDAVKKEEKWTTPMGETIKMKVYFKHNETHLFVGLECSSPGLANIFIQKDKEDTIYVLHSSGALGEARYKYDQNKKYWVLKKGFHFPDFHKTVKENRDKGKSKEEAVELATHGFEIENGWRANYLTAETREETPQTAQFEFRIAYAKLGIDPSKINPKDLKGVPVIKIVAGIAGNGLLTWPPDVKDGSSDMNIHCGDDVPQVEFTPETWCSIIPSDNWLKPQEKGGEIVPVSHEKEQVKKEELKPMVKEFQVTYAKGGYPVNCYLLTCPKSKKTALIDMGGEPDRVFKHLTDNKLSLQYIIITHLHDDHCAEIETLQSKLSDPVPVYSYSPYPAGKKSIRVKDGETLKLGELAIKVIHTPGHAPNAICLYVNGVLFAGDSLDIHCGKEMVAETVKCLERANVPDDTICYRGHEPASTLGKIKKELKSK